MPNSQSHPSSATDLLSNFDCDGYVVIRGLYTPNLMTAWKDRIIRILADQGAIKSPTGVKVWMAEALNPYFHQALTSPPLLPVLQQIIGPDIEFLSVKPVFKNATTTFASPWHQDWFYWRGSHKVSAWIALDPTDQSNGCLKVIPGSHRAVATMIKVKDGKGFGNRMPDEAIVEEEAVSIEVEPGDIVIFHDLLQHASHPNTARADRWALIPTYRDGSQPDNATIWKRPFLVSGRSVNGAAPEA